MVKPTSETCTNSRCKNQKEHVSCVHEIAAYWSSCITLSFVPVTKGEAQSVINKMICRLRKGSIVNVDRFVSQADRKWREGGSQKGKSRDTSSLRAETAEKFSAKDSSAARQTSLPAKSCGSATIAQILQYPFLLVVGVCVQKRRTWEREKCSRNQQNRQ